MIIALRGLLAQKWYDERPCPAHKYTASMKPRVDGLLTYHKVLLLRLRAVYESFPFSFTEHSYHGLDE